MSHEWFQCTDALLHFYTSVPKLHTQLKNPNIPHAAPYSYNPVCIIQTEWYFNDPNDMTTIKRRITACNKLNDHHFDCDLAFFHSVMTKLPQLSWNSVLMLSLYAVCHSDVTPLDRWNVNMFNTCYIYFIKHHMLCLQMSDCIVTHLAVAGSAHYQW